MTCPACDYANPDGSLFCGRCGTRLTPHCAVCGTPLTPGTRFCTQCGAPVVGDNRTGAAVDACVLRRDRRPIGNRGQQVQRRALPISSRRWAVRFASLASLGSTALPSRGVLALRQE